MEFEIKSYFDDLHKNNYLKKDDYKFRNLCVTKPGVMYRLCKGHKDATDNNNIHYFVQFCLQLVVAITTFQNFLYQF